MEINWEYISKIKPLAELRSGMDGVRIIAEVSFKSCVDGLYFFTPPTYDLIEDNKIEKYILHSAISKHGYIPVDGGLIHNCEEFEEYLREAHLSI
jgi:hypothetical protein